MKQKLENVKLAIIGLGYVGLPLAVEFSKKYSVIGYDVDGKRIKELKKGIDFTNEISEKNLLNSKTLKFTNSKDKLISANIFIITVPTPVDKNNKPNLNPIQSASSLVGHI